MTPHLSSSTGQGVDLDAWAGLDAWPAPALVDPNPALIEDLPSDPHDLEVVARRLEVDEKHRRVVGFLDEHRLDGVVLTRADSIAWFTAGAWLAGDLATEGSAVALYVNRTTRAIIADNVQSPRIFEEELAGLGFQLKERPWHQDPMRIIPELTHNKRVAADTPWPGLDCETDRLRDLRCPLTARERDVLRTLGRLVAHAVEATGRTFQAGQTEAEVAGQVAHRMLRNGITPVEIRVASDDRRERHRRPTFKAIPIERAATLTAVGRRGGLCVAATRSISFGPVDPRWRDCHTVAAMVDASCIFFSRPGEPIAEVFRRARRLFEKFDHPHEWTLDYQGVCLGYSARDRLLTPDDATPLVDGSAIAWSPSVGVARSGDTVAIDTRGAEVLTRGHNWPMIEVAVKGCPLLRPGILER